MSLLIIGSIIIGLLQGVQIEIVEVGSRFGSPRFEPQLTFIWSKAITGVLIWGAVGWFTSQLVGGYFATSVSIDERLERLENNKVKTRSQSDKARDSSTTTRNQSDDSTNTSTNDTTIEPSEEKVFEGEYCRNCHTKIGSDGKCLTEVAVGHC